MVPVAETEPNLVPCVLDEYKSLAPEYAEVLPYTSTVFEPDPTVIFTDLTLFPPDVVDTIPELEFLERNCILPLLSFAELPAYTASDVIETPLKFT